MAQETGGHYLDQFTNAERATDWRGNNNIAESIFAQMRRRDASGPGVDRGRRRHRRDQRDHRPLHPLSPLRHPVVCRRPRELRVLSGYAQGRDDVVTGVSSRIEGIGRPRVEPSFLPDVVDRMVAVPDAASIAAARHVSAVLGRRVGPSTGTNLWGAFGLLAEMVAEGRSGSVVTLIADSGDRYADTYFNDEWLASARARPVDRRRRAGRVRAFRLLALILGFPGQGPVGGQDQPQRGQDEESPVDGSSQPGHLAPRFSFLRVRLRFACAYAAICRHSA